MQMNAKAKTLLGIRYTGGTKKSWLESWNSFKSKLQAQPLVVVVPFFSRSYDLFRVDGSMRSFWIVYLDRVPERSGFSLLDCTWLVLAQ